MSFFNQPFDPSQHEAQGAFQPLPTGNYQVIITSAQEKQNSRQNGSFLALEMQIPDGQKYAKRRLFYRINLQNPNPECVAIGVGQLAALCQAAKLPQLTAVSQLCNRIVTVKVAVKDHWQNPGEKVNEVTGVVLEDQTNQPPAQDNGQPSTGQGTPAW